MGVLDRVEKSDGVEIYGAAIGGGGVRTVTGALVLCLAACSGGVGEGDGEDPWSPPGQGFTNEFEEGDVVAEFELAAPTSADFVVHGTLPLPPGLYLPGSALAPFTLRDSDGTIVPAQVEVVSRYPASDDGADVVELLARVPRPGGASPGDRIEYDVLWSPHTPAAHTIDAEVQTLIQTPGAVTLRTSDVFGHVYEADLLADLRQGNANDLRTKRDGLAASQWRTYENLEPVVPVSGSTGTLPHLMGVHSYVTSWQGEPVISLDLRLHNGHEGRDATTDSDDPMGKVYFEDLELVVPDGWVLAQAYPTPTFGTFYNEGAERVWPLVTPIPGGDLHVMEIQAQFHRRLVLYRAGHEVEAQSTLREEGLAFCRDGANEGGFRYLSWWNPISGRYWAQNFALPTLDYLESPAQSRGDLEGDSAAVEAALNAGTPGPWPVNYGALGWAHPWGPQSGGFQGGSEIYYWDGLRTAWGASNAGYRLFQMQHRMYTERHATALYDRYGEPYNLEDWVYEGPNGPILPTWLFIIPWLPLGDPHGFTSAPTFQVDAVAAQDRKPDYEDTLAGFGWVDKEHLIRYTRSAKVLVWLGNDALAKDDLFLQAELCRGTYSILPQNEFDEVITTGMLWDLRYIETNPQDGFNIDRGEGWILDTAASYYALADPAWRTQARPWFDDVIGVIELGQSACSGTIMSKPNLAHFGGQYRLVQSISECILQNGLWGVRSSVLDGQDPAMVTRVNNIIKKSTAAMISPQIWSTADSSPYFYTALGPHDQEQPAFCGYVPPDGHEGNDGWQTWNVFAFGYLLTGSSQYLSKATEQAGGSLTVNGVTGDGGTGKLETRAGVLSLLQNQN